MQNRIEPPILLSRLLTLVFAASLVVLVVLAITLYKLFPLDRPEVFFLRTVDPTNTEITLNQVVPDGGDLEQYKRAFITEYIKARNEIVPNTYTMDKQWASVQKMSSEDIYAEFANTNMYQRFRLNSATGSDMGISCSVDFPRGSVSAYKQDGETFLVTFHWFCTNNYGQTGRKVYKIKIRLVTDDVQSTKWVDHMENPLGLRVTEYSIESGDTDPLNTFGATNG